LYRYTGGVLGKRAAEMELDADGKPVKKKKEKRQARAPTAFNLFMKKEVAATKITKPHMVRRLY
jgi:hypothetical protein